MALENTDYSYLGLGPVYIREYGSKLGMDDAGNCSQLNFAVTEDSKKLTDYTKPGGGTRNEVRRITAVEVTLTMHDFSPANLARAVYGETSALVSDDVAGEQIAAFKGKVIRLAHLMPTDVVVKSVGGSATTYTEGTDYIVSDAGIIIPADSTIPDATVTAGVPVANITVDYTYGAGDVVEALVNSGKEWELVFAGLNEARSGKPMVVEAYRIKFGAASALALIADDFGALELTGTVLSDGTKIGTGISKYFKATIAK